MPEAPTELRRLRREDMARLAAEDIPEGSCVNLGIGMPILVARYLPKDREIILHSENGILGWTGLKDPADRDPDLISPGKDHISLLPGAAIADSSMSFAMMRGGHLDYSFLGAYQVAGNGDLANWHNGDPNVLPAVGGAMDLTVGAKRIHVLMEHTTRKGEPRIVERCSLPLTGLGVVDRIYTDLCVIDLTPDGLVVTGLLEGCSREYLQAATGVPLSFAGELRTLAPH